MLDADVKRDSGNHTQTTEFETTTTDTDSDDEFEQMRYVMITSSNNPFRNREFRKNFECIN